MRHFWAQNGSLATNFFSEKNYIIFIHLLDPFILQNFKKILTANPELWGCAIFGPKIPPFVQNNIFWYKPLLLLSSTYWLFSMGTIKKKSYNGSKVMRICHFWVQNGPFAFFFFFFFLKIINITLIYLLAPFIVQNFKKILPADPELWGCAIFGPKMAHFPKWEFFRKTC